MWLKPHPGDLPIPGLLREGHFHLKRKDHREAVSPGKQAGPRQTQGGEEGRSERGQIRRGSGCGAVSLGLQSALLSKRNDRSSKTSREQILLSSESPREEKWKITTLSLCGNTSYSERTAEPGVCNQLAGSLGHPVWWPLRPDCLRAPVLCLLLAGHIVLELNALLRLGVQLALGSCAS